MINGLSIPWHIAGTKRALLAFYSDSWPACGANNTAQKDPSMPSPIRYNGTTYGSKGELINYLMSHCAGRVCVRLRNGKKGPCLSFDINFMHPDKADEREITCTLFQAKGHLERDQWRIVEEYRDALHRTQCWSTLMFGRKLDIIKEAKLAPDTPLSHVVEYQQAYALEQWRNPLQVVALPRPSTL